LTGENVNNPLEYIECIELYGCKYRSTWKRHTVNRAEMASRLAECYACTRRLRRCSKSLYSAYRRLEDYAKCVGLVDTRNRKGYGRLCEYTFYYKYDSKKPSWSRHVEVRVVVPVPLHIDCNSIEGIAENYAYNTIEALYMDVPFELEWKKGGRDVPGEYDGIWCNTAARVALDEDVEIEVHDYRGYDYNAIIRGGWCRFVQNDPSIVEVKL